MKVYKCDACGQTIENPYKEKMKEFIVSTDFEGFTWNFKNKIKLDLCKECFEGLHYLAELKAEKALAERSKSV